MAAVHRRNIGLYGACGDLVRHATAVAEAVDRGGHPAVAAWLQGCVLAVVSALTDGRDPELLLDRAEAALLVCRRRVGVGADMLHGFDAVAGVRSWWAFDPVRDGSPPTVYQDPLTTAVPVERD